jgi:hypothetical protein
MNAERRKKKQNRNQVRELMRGLDELGCVVPFVSAHCGDSILLIIQKHPNFAWKHIRRDITRVIKNVFGEHVKVRFPGIH